MLRRRLRSARQHHNAHRVDSAAVCRRLLRLDALQQARTVLLYHSLPGEVDVSALAVSVPRPVWPVVVGRALPLELRGRGPTVRGPWGLTEPGPDCPLVPIEDVDVVVVPGVAFDALGGRLGMGGGFYDRTLQGTRALRIAVAFDLQIVDRVPREPHDLTMDLVVTPTRTLVGPASRAQSGAPA